MRFDPFTLPARFAAGLALCAALLAGSLAWAQTPDATLAAVFVSGRGAASLAEQERLPTTTGSIPSTSPFTCKRVSP